MRILLDTHTFLWAVLEDEKLSAEARRLWLDEGNELLLSAASVWEIGIKVRLGSLTIQGGLDEFVSRQLNVDKLSLIPISVKHAACVSTLPLHHRDPFDRMLIAQSIVEGVPVLSADLKFDAYGVERRW